MPAYSIQHLHNYLFSTMANVNTVGQFAENHRKKKHKEINDFFNGVIASRKRSEFNAFLQGLNNPALRNALSIDEPTAGDSTRPYLPATQAVNIEFNKLNEQYKIFDSSNVALSKKFEVYFRIAKIIADFIETNNNDTDSVAYLHAYKMMVIFGGEEQESTYFKPFEKFLNQHNGFNNHAPVHDALINALPVCNEAGSLNLASWRKIIMERGVSAIELFTLAADMEAKYGKTPESYEEAVKMAATLQYKNAAQYPELAKLCKFHHLSEEIFERCLEIEKKRKTNDILPDVMIDGNQVGFPGYHLLKLPIDDPRAYILGSITNCCQSVGGESEACVVDGITLETNGFYVLLKNIKKQDTVAPPMINGKINYASYAIVGQGYAWLTTRDNLTFDSWENLNETTDNKVVATMLPEFCRRASAADPKLLRVTIGAGGKTPSEFKEGKRLKHGEKPQQGTEYGDANQQDLVYQDEVKLNDLMVKVKNAFLRNLNLETDEEVSRYIDKRVIRSVSAAEQLIETLDRDHDFFMQLLDLARPKALLNTIRPLERSKLKPPPQNITFRHPVFIKIIHAYQRTLWPAFVMLSAKGILNNQTCDLLFYDPTRAIKVAEALCSLQGAGLLNDATIAFLARASQHIAYACELILLLAKHCQLTAENMSALQAAITNRYYLPCIRISQSIELLTEQHLLTQKYLFIIFRLEHPHCFAQAIIQLHKSSMLDDAMLAALAESGEYAKTIADELLRLYEAGIATDANIALLFELKKIETTSDSPDTDSDMDDNLGESGRVIAADDMSKAIIALETQSLLNNDNKNYLKKIAAAKSLLTYYHFSQVIIRLTKVFATHPEELNSLLDKFVKNEWEDLEVGQLATIVECCKACDYPLDFFNNILQSSDRDDVGEIANALAALRDANLSPEKIEEALNKFVSIPSNSLKP